MHRPQFNYVRTYRLRGGLTAKDLGFLVGQRSATAISQYEAGSRVPTLYVALALEVVFGLKPRELFPEFFEQVEDEVMRRVRTLDAELADKVDRRSQACRRLIEAIPHRGSDNDIIL